MNPSQVLRDSDPVHPFAPKSFAGGDDESAEPMDNEAQEEDLLEQALEFLQEIAPSDPKANELVAKIQSFLETHEEKAEGPPPEQGAPSPAPMGAAPMMGAG